MNKAQKMSDEEKIKLICSYMNFANKLKQRKFGNKPRENYILAEPLQYHECSKKDYLKYVKVIVNSSHDLDRKHLQKWIANLGLEKEWAKVDK